MTTTKQLDSHLQFYHTPQPPFIRRKSILSPERRRFPQGENMPAYHACPKNADGPLPIVIVVQEIFMHEHIRDLVAAPKYRKAISGYRA